MIKYLIPVVALLTTSCLSSTIESDVSIEHTFQLPALPATTNTAPGTVQGCYNPDVASTFEKFTSGSPSEFTWNITHLQDTITMNDMSGIQQISLSLVNGDNKVILSNSTPIDPAQTTVTLESATIDSAVMHSLLTSYTTQICLTLVGKVSSDSAIFSKNVISFTIEADLNKSL